MASYKWTKWTDERVAEFIGKYPNSSWDELLRDFPFTKSSLITKASELGVKRASRYTKEDDKRIEELVGLGATDEEIANELGRSVSGIRTRRERLRLLLKTYWTEDEDRIMSQYYGIMPALDVASMLPGRTYDAVIMRAGVLGLSGYKAYHEYTDEEYAFIKDNYKTMTDEEIGSILGHPAASIKNHRNKIGLHRWEPGGAKYGDANVYVRHNNADWKRRSMQNCGYQCVITGARFDDVHHLVSLNTIIENALKALSINPLTFDIDAISEDDRKFFLAEVYKQQDETPLGVCLRRDIHMEFHNIYGYGKNTPEQFYEFVHTHSPRV